MMERFESFDSGIEQNNKNISAPIVSSSRILYTPSAFARTSLIHLQEIGSLLARQPHVNQRSNLSSYLFFMVESGSGKLVYRDINYELRPGDCIFIDCRQPYAHSTDNDLWSLKWCHFFGPSMANIYAKYVERGGRPTFHPESLASFEDVWSKVYKVAKSSDYVRDMKINEGLTALLTLIMSESWHPGSQREGLKKQNILPIKNYLDEHYEEKITLDGLSTKFYINKYYLTRLFKEQFGVSIHNYLLQVRITHAKQLLRFTKEKVETIGRSCGIGDLHYFSRTFKKVEGISPSEYREMW